MADLFRCGLWGAACLLAKFAYGFYRILSTGIIDCCHHSHPLIFRQRAERPLLLLHGSCQNGIPDEGIEEGQKVESSVFISPTRTKALIQRIAELSGRHDAEKLCASVYTGKVVKAENNQVFLTIDVINQAINTGKKISFQHYKYDGNRNRIMRNNGEIYTVSPYLTVWKNDRYYLVGWADNRAAIRSFRIDRMALPILLDEPAQPKPESFDPYFYYCTFTKMYSSGPEMDITLKCDDALMNNIIDRFGDDFIFNRADDTHFLATVHVNASDTFWGWLFEYAGRMKVEEPEDAKQLYRDRLEKALKE